MYQTWANARHSLAAQRKRERRAMTRLVLVARGMVVVMQLSSVLLARRFASPMLQLAETAHRVGEGDLDTYAEYRHGGDGLCLLTNALNRMVDVIFKYEGTLDKYIGVAVMAVFGSPIPQEDAPLRAVRTALEMQQHLTGLNDMWGRQGKQKHAMGIGINTGDVIAGNVGDPRRMEYTVIGDNVNMASRIETLTKNYNCPIIISKSTYDHVRDLVQARELETVAVKGKKKAVLVYELLGLKSQA